MQWTISEIALILNALTHKYGFGYSDIPEVGQLQAKLSIMGEMASQRDGAMSHESEELD